MPRVHGIRERRQYDFAWSFPIEPDQSVELFTEEALAYQPRVPVRMMRVERSFVCFDGTTIILETGLSRPDAILSVHVDQHVAAYSGPWMQRSAIALHDLYSIYDDAVRESKEGKRKKMDAIGILREVVERSKYGGVYRPLILNQRKPIAAHVRLLPNVAGGVMQAHMRVLFTVELQ